MRRMLLLAGVFIVATIITFVAFGRRGVMRPLTHVTRTTARPVVPWPVFDTRCRDDERCLLARYQRAFATLVGMEVGGLEVMLGEALAGAAPMHAAITPADGAPSVERCNKLSRAPITVATETLRRPQRDCFFACLRAASADTGGCVRTRGCARLPVLDGGWELVQIVPRLGCLASLATTSARCKDLEISEHRAGTTTSCEPRRMCEHGASAVPDPMRPFVIAGDTDCTTRPATWWCEERTVTFPRAACEYGS